MGAFKYFQSRYITAALSLAVLLCVGLSCKVKPDSEWKSELGGKQLSRASNSGAVSSKVSIYFCPSGEYALQSQFSGYSTGGAGTLSMANEDVEYGHWTVENSTLILRSQKGQTRQYEMFQGMDDNVIELDGAGYLVTTHNECES